MKVFPILIFCICFMCSCSSNKTTVVKLQCEHLENPLGIDSPYPRLSWQINSPEQGAKQTAYQVEVSTSLSDLTAGKATVWNSGPQQSDSILLTYKGSPLQSFTKYYWRVSCWDQNDKKVTSKIHSFETAMLDYSLWQGKWITDQHDSAYKPAPYFRKLIKITKPIQSARVYISAAGLYQLHVNGTKVGDRMLDPMYTRFDRRNLYATLDITEQMQEGNNAVGVLLGNGWYNHQSTAVWYFDQAIWRNRPRFIANIRINYTDGSNETIVTDNSWKTADSPIVFNSIYTAEHYDARKEIANWDQAIFDDSLWQSAKGTNPPSPKLASQQLHPIRVVARITPNKVDKKNDSLYVFTFPRNIAGVVQLNLKNIAPGITFRLKHAERLYKDGMVDLSNIDLHYRPTDDSDPFQTDIYTTAGKPSETFSPTFNYKGFQYVEVLSSQTVHLTADNLEALEMHSDLPAIGRINTSNPVFNKIWAATNSSYLANMFGYPTDCPQREKNGWTGDGQTAVETGLYNFEGITVYEKWLADHQDEQNPDGLLPNIIPTSGWGYQWANGPDWTSSMVIIPWQIYQFYGDSRLLAKVYDNMKKYVDLIDQRYPSGITDWGLGDWVPVKTTSSKHLTSSTYFYADALILSKTAALLGKKADQIHYQQLAQKIKDSVNFHLFNKTTAIYCSGTQTELAGPLFWGLVPEEYRQRVADNLYKKVQESNLHLDVGLLGTKTLLNALSENGYADAAYTIASQETFPSWGYWIVNGATTLYENWPLEVEKNDASLNHIMFGEIGAWMYKGIGGIFPDEQHPGFKNTLLKPNFVTGLDHFEATHQSPYGLIVSKWERGKDMQIYYSFEIPANASATLFLPSKYHTTFKTKVPPSTQRNQFQVWQLPAGKYFVEIK